MRPLPPLWRLRRRHPHVGGQGIVEFALVLPIFMFLLLIMLEFGLAFHDSLTIGLATREGARTAAALGNGNTTDCSGGLDPANVDAQIVAGIQRILKSPGSDVVMANVSWIRIYRSDANGRSNGNNGNGSNNGNGKGKIKFGPGINLWKHAPGAGPDIDPGPGVDRLDFAPVWTAWPACLRDDFNDPDAVGVSITYDYQLQTALSSFARFMGGSQAGVISMDDQTTMIINPNPR